MLEFMRWAGLKIAVISPTGIEFNYVPSGINPEQFFTVDEIDSDLNVKLAL